MSWSRLVPTRRDGHVAIAPSLLSADFSRLGDEIRAVDLIAGAGRHQPDALPSSQRAVDDTDKHNDTEISVVPAVHEHGLERGVHIACRRRQARDNGLKHIVNTKPRLG